MKEHYENLLENGFEFDITKYVNGGWNLFKEKAGSFIGFFWLSVLLFISFSSLAFLNPAIGILSLVILYFIIFAGYYSFIKAQINGDAQWNNFFIPWATIVQVLINTFFIFLITLPIYLVMLYIIEFPFDLYFKMIEDFKNSQAILLEIEQWSNENWLRNNLVQYSASIIVGILNTLFMFSYMLIIDKGMKSTDALWLSRKIISKKLIHFILISILVNLILIGGMLFTCFLGTMVVIPLSMCINYYMYDSICNNKN